MNPARYWEAAAEGVMLTNDLQAAIAASYEAFAAFPRPPTLRTSRDPREFLAMLSSAPLQQLTGDQIGPYASWAITTAGDDRDYRHFLPRIFELAVTDPSWLGFDPAVMANKLDIASWHNWPDEQRQTVLRFFRAAFEAALATHPHEHEAAADWFCGLVKLGESASLTFQRWRSGPSSNAALHLAMFINGDGVRGPIWGDVEMDIRRDVVRHLVSDETKTYLRAAANEVSDEDRFQYIDAALANLERPILKSDHPA